MKGNPLVYLLVAVLAGCAAPIRESKTPLSMYVRLYIENLDDSHSAVKIITVEQAGEPDTRYAPSPSGHDLWLRPGAYEATLKCLRPPADPYTTGILASAASTDLSGHFHFTIEFRSEFGDNPYAKDATPYEIDCAISADGKPEFVITPMPWSGI